MLQTDINEALLQLIKLVDMAFLHWLLDWTVMTSGVSRYSKLVVSRV